ncbi:hypothetical protein ERICIV_04542 (plasmid) [Paenibacillus larvae subsp. larvae]|uniref:Uncharacterized protein n=1 Tax=Paenibacillus larvae subsp. larvae TaxID=147375 RepID=A0A2L1U7K8_9BACL|nr:hypothetical protein [Paenibacillus larvae]AVF28924.1 hypothetical protein ERICIII_04922 [Paenibacillus larvae subsp. larvae]AVF33306.1 hypothetical protein ERICIV_04542 [Paenibacillus larvae subsp. larvae]MCY7518877.1 hypothetical protein [Paenibacillus larvae]MCY9502642.1 hypothetical protein [Paenibacillus larvae]MCY9677943.1 hypothetical protein [Paenibacillus larvae]
MEFIKKLIAYLAFLLLLGGVIAYAYPLLTGAGKDVSNDTVKTINDVRNIK